MNLKQLLEGLEYQTKLSDTEIKTVTGDSRQVENGSLFVCIKGEKSDGHKYADKAIENGASAILCQQDLGLDNQILVADSRYAYSIVCRNFFEKADEKLRLIGITGTNGKTTVTYLLKHVLESCGKKVGLIGTIQTMIDD
ncbi:MAG: Mur ligase domain-containing protein, partial [Oscillospiraceae bacterium]